MTYRPLIKQDPERALPFTEAYRKKRLNPPKGGRTFSYLSALACRSDEMYDELTTRITVLQATISDLCDELNKRAVEDQPTQATRDPGGTP